ncbi:acyltransferase family protein [Billgrantia lactosivorans]|uniref:acyltransferase family protein n=1 Tax=Billgrantia lactosivorans TaxID=2185141 RepID=UPI000DAEFC89|nr:acyltransferase family protein [Halomonas lactosivorans]
MASARDPYPDALRAVALVVVVLGHWVATLPRFEAGRLVATGHLLDAWTPAGYFTWIVQVVPLFVFVSAAVSAAGGRERDRAGESHAHWWAGRGLGLARPTVTYLAVLVAVAGLSFVTREGILDQLNASLTVHLWFLAVLLGVQLLLPACLWAERRWGMKSVVALVMLAATVDLMRASPGSANEFARFGARVIDRHDVFAWVNALVFWIVPQLLGIAWWEKRFSGRAKGAGMVLLGAAWLGLAIVVGYPPSMVNGNLGGETNLLPPTLALFGVVWLQVGAVMLFEKPVRTFLERRHLGRWMALFGAFGLQLYLWHKLAELPAAWLGQRLDWPIDAGVPGEAGFWLGRLEWIGLCTLMVVPVMLAVVAFERRRRPDVVAAQGKRRILVGGVALFGGLGASLLLGAWPGAFVGLPLVAIASWLLRAPRQA